MNLANLIKTLAEQQMVEQDELYPPSSCVRTPDHIKYRLLVHSLSVVKRYFPLPISSGLEKSPSSS